MRRCYNFEILQKNIWYDATFNLLEIAEVFGKELIIYDLIGPLLSKEYLRSLTWPGAKRATLCFTPDRFTGPITAACVYSKNDPLFLLEFTPKATQIFRDEIQIPALART